MKTVYGLFFFLAVLAAAGCNLKTEPINPLFSGTTFISTFLPKDTSTVPVTFTWTSPGSSVAHEVVGVFTNQIVVDNMQITNIRDCIAMWTTGMTGSAGEVPFSNFKKVVNGVIQTDAAVYHSGTMYWAVWGYDSGLKITHSSAQKSFTTN